MMTPEECDENTQPNLGLWRNGKLNTGKKSYICFRNSCWNAVWEIEIQTDTHHRRSITLNEKLKLDYFFLLTLFFNIASRLYNEPIKCKRMNGFANQSTFRIIFVTFLAFCLRSLSPCTLRHPAKKGHGAIVLRKA